LPTHHNKSTTMLHNMEGGPSIPSNRRDEHSMESAGVGLRECTWNLIPEVLQKLQTDRISATLIAPWWPSAIWFPTPQKLAQSRPLKIPDHMVLPPPGHNQSVLLGNPHWSLSAWKIRFED
jgi:hypothetical protein